MNRNIIFSISGLFFSLISVGSGRAQDILSIFPPSLEYPSCLCVDYFAYKRLISVASNIYELPDSTAKPARNDTHYLLRSPQEDEWSSIHGTRWGTSEKLAKEYKQDQFWQMYYRQNTGRNIKEEKTKLIAMLTEMKSTMSPLPDIFRYIEKKHKGNINACVDYWFAHSIFTDSITRRDFLKKPTAKRLKRDPAYMLTRSLVKSKAQELLESNLSLPTEREHLCDTFTDEDLWQLNLENVACFYQRINLLEKCKILQEFGGTAGYRKSWKLATANNIEPNKLGLPDFFDPEYYTSIVKTPTSWEASKRFMKQEVRNWVVANEPLAVREFIRTRFHDDTDAFVDYMYKHSIFAGYRNFERFNYMRSAKQIREDPFVLYSISRQQYLKSKQ